MQGNEVVPLFWNTCGNNFVDIFHIDLIAEWNELRFPSLKGDDDFLCATLEKLVNINSRCQIISS